ncbi:MAG: hypothetical protein U9Q83_04880 [Bacteroidota bacterium]|nr:hypothetical protein [Bacteroidota bacterium]
MEEKDYFSWLVAFNSYKDEYPDSKFVELISTTKGIILMRQVIERLYYEKLETHSLERLIRKTDKKLNEKELEKLLKKIKKDKIVDLYIFKKLEKIDSELEEKSPLKLNLNSRTITLSMIETIKEKLDVIEDIDKVIKEVLAEIGTENNTKKVIDDEDDDFSDDSDEDYDEIDEMNISDE